MVYFHYCNQKFFLLYLHKPSLWFLKFHRHKTIKNTFINRTIVQLRLRMLMSLWQNTIENHNLSCKITQPPLVHIYDSNGSLREVEGEGVKSSANRKINPGEQYHIQVVCQPALQEMGKMHGNFAYRKNVNQ